jgi:hypothetical protein
MGEGPISFNIIKNRGDPQTATTLSGHVVQKKDFVIVPNPLDPEIKQMIALRCADYHMEHFVYIDPLFAGEVPKSEKRHFWWAMCTCGSPAVMIDGMQAAVHDGQDYDGSQTSELVYGHGFHQGQENRKWL